MKRLPRFSRVDRRRAGQGAMSLVLAGSLLLTAVPLQARRQAEAQQDQGGGIEIDIGLDNAQNVQVESIDDEKRQLEAAQARMNVEDWAGAAVGFHGVLKNPKAKAYHEQSEYLLAKSLYRLGYYHSALERFVSVLRKGEAHKYYQTSKEWLFFISRKTSDQGVVAEEIARYAANELPEKYADEFHFLLARMYFRKAADEGEERKKGADEKKDENLDFESGDLGSGGDGPTSGLNHGYPGSAGDDMEFGLDDMEDTPKKKKGKKEPPPKKETGKKGKKGKEPPPSFSEEEPPPAKKAPPPKEEEALEFQLDDTPPAKEVPKPEPKKAAPKAADAPPEEQPVNELVGDAKQAMLKCVEHSSQVRETSSLFLRATYLRAVCQYELNDFEKATEGFREVVRITKSGKYANSPLREEAFFSLARTHYAFRQFRAAIFYYSRITRDSSNWLDALFESSWAYFRLADYEKALGNLVTLHAPFFENEYFPESHILKAVTYYENCRYPESLSILDEFEGQYGPLRDELERLTKDAKTPDDYYELLRKLDSTKNASPLTVRLSGLAKGDKSLAALISSAREIEEEERKITIARGAMAQSELQKELSEGAKKRRISLVEQAGGVARAKLQAERDELKALSSQLFRIKFEVTKREKETLEAELRGEKQSVALGGYRYTVAVPDDYEYWPFDGEYWRDELGTYEYTLSKGCRQ